MSRWIEEGGDREDDGAWYDYLLGWARSYRHFHDPLRPWAEAGLSPTLPFFSRWESAVRWAQQANQQAETGFGDYSWVNARAYFHQALTAETPAAREAAFAQTFRALGQVMHLLADMSVPEHVRDDRHPIEGPFGYEGWVLAQHRGGAAVGGLAPYLQGGPPVDPALFAIPPRPGEPIAISPIARLFDSDRYEGAAPDPAVTAEEVIGLAEVTNANFFSSGSVNYPYPHPVRAALVAYQATYEKSGTRRIYYSKPAPGLAVTPALVECVLDEVANTRGVCADDAVFRATARHLLPRAVSYSAALLDYFFRGKLDFEVYPDWQNPDQSILSIRNRSDEPMVGTFTLYTENRDGRRVPVPGASADGVSLAGVGAPDWDTTGTQRIAFTPESGFDIGGLALVFTGVLGAEQGVVVGSVTPWEPAIFGIQELAEVTGDEIAETSTPEVDGETGKMGGWSGESRASRHKETRRQRVQGRFAASQGAVAGDYIKRIFFFFGWGGAPGISFRLNDSVDIGFEWDRETGPGLVPATWEIAIDLTGNTMSAPPAGFYVETRAGVYWWVPIVWWDSNMSSGFVSVSYGLGDCIEAERVTKGTTTSAGSMVAFLGMQPGAYLPLDGFAGYPPGTRVDPPVSQNPFEEGCPDSHASMSRSVSVFVAEDGGQSARVWESRSYIGWVGWSEIGYPPAAAPHPGLFAGEIRVRRDYATWERARLRLHGVVAPEAHIVTLR